MYPIFSLLRRLSAAHIYVSEPMLTVQAGAFYVRLDKPSNFLDVHAERWSDSVDLVPISRITFEGSNSKEAAISVSAFENKVAEGTRAEQALYTMVVGPEGEEMLDDGRVRRYCTYALVRGVYRASSTRLVQQAAQNAPRAKFRKLPKGTVRL